MLINPLRVDKVPERFPTIVQDAIVIGLFAIVATFVLDEKFMTTSAVGAVVVGFALQDTLGNMFSGLAIQIEKPFQVGHWIRAGDYEGNGHRGHLARDQGPHAPGQPRHGAQQRGRQGAGHELLRADRPVADRGRRRRARTTRRRMR